jgi:iron only hydrogenase large subunit-like protein
VAIMPCFDKKLEASREDFYSDILQSRDVDLVLATNEMPDLFEKYNVNFIQLKESPLDDM